jgi:hypothetical protein
MIVLRFCHITTLMITHLAPYSILTGYNQENHAITDIAQLQLLWHCFMCYVQKNNGGDFLKWRWNMRRNRMVRDINVYERLWSLEARLIRSCSANTPLYRLAIRLKAEMYCDLLRQVTETSSIFLFFFLAIDLACALQSLSCELDWRWNEAMWHSPGRIASRNESIPWKSCS